MKFSPVVVLVALGFVVPIVGAAAAIPDGFSVARVTKPLVEVRGGSGSAGIRTHTPRTRTYVPRLRTRAPRFHAPYKTQSWARHQHHRRHRLYTL